MKKNLTLLLAASAAVFLGAGCASSGPVYSPPAATPPAAQAPAPAVTPSPVNLSFPGKLPDAQIVGKQVRLKTDQGDIVIALYPDTAPLAVSNFIYLVGQGYYDGILFHRVCPNPADDSCGGLQIVQGGDPQTKTLPLTDPRIGTGGPGYSFPDELNDKRTYVRGIVAMANAGRDTNGSQFFLMKADIPFPKNYTIFGNVISGMDVADKLVKGSKIISATVENAK
jgi:cyclophilin family peptidyl-prolyl cis-trans isomerase/predicted small lipoprotein YifL